MATKADPFVLSAAANTAAELEGMKTSLFKVFDDMMAEVRAGRDVAADHRVFYKYQASRVARRCADLVDELLLLSGAKGVFEDNPMVRPWLDLKTGRNHIANNSNLARPDAGRIVPVGAPVMDYVPVKGTSSASLCKFPPDDRRISTDCAGSPR